ncbi:MAG: hypothetical protein ACQESK_09935 [Bacteroidota bacterium]
MSKNNSIGFSLEKITTDQFAIIDTAYSKDQAVDVKVGFKFGADQENKFISISFSTSFLQEKSPFLLIEVSCVFKITDEAWQDFLSDDKREMNFPKGFVAHLAMITVGTLRGVLHARTENTPFNEFLLPTINVADLIEKDIHFDLDAQQAK